MLDATNTIQTQLQQCGCICQASLKQPLFDDRSTMRRLRFRAKWRCTELCLVMKQAWVEAMLAERDSCFFLYSRSTRYICSSFQPRVHAQTLTMLHICLPCPVAPCFILLGCNIWWACCSEGTGCRIDSPKLTFRRHCRANPRTVRCLYRHVGLRSAISQTLGRTWP